MQKQYAVFVGNSREFLSFDWDKAQHYYDRQAEAEGRRPKHLQAPVTLQAREVSDWTVIEPS